MKSRLLAAGLILLAAPALARAPDQAVAPPSASTSVDPAALALAHDTLANLRLDDLVRTLATAKIGDLVGETAGPTPSVRLGQAKTSANAVLDQMLPTLDGELADALARTLTPENLTQLNGFVQGHALQSMIGSAFSQARGAGKPAMSDQDTADIRAFLKSPTGRALQADIPALKPRVERIVKTLAPRFVDAFESDFCGRVTCTDADHARFKALRVRAQS